MQTSVFEAPALFGDHHVTEVRRLLSALNGVGEVYASSAFRAVQVTFDPKKINAGEIEDCLRQSGYLNEPPIPAEAETAAIYKEGEGSFRHTAVYETVRGTVAFAQSVSSTGRPSWPYPGLDPVQPAGE